VRPHRAPAVHWAPTQWTTTIGRFTIWVELEGRCDTRWAWHVCGPRYDADGQAATLPEAKASAIASFVRSQVPARQRRKRSAA